MNTVLLEVSAVMCEAWYLSLLKYCTSKLIVTDDVLVNTVAVCWNKLMLGVEGGCCFMGMHKQTEE